MFHIELAKINNILARVQRINRHSFDPLGFKVELRSVQFYIILASVDHLNVLQLQAIQRGSEVEAWRMLVFEDVEFIMIDPKHY